MTALVDKIQKRLFKSENHPYRILERKGASLVRLDHTVLDAGCGYTAPLLSAFRGKAGKLIGVDLVDFKPSDQTLGMELIKGDLGNTGLESGSVDLIVSRSVMEHVEDAPLVYREMHRILKPGGHFLFLTPNFWDYVSLISSAVPNRFHGWMVSKTEGRHPEDTFPAFYRSNTKGAIKRLSRMTGFDLISIDYLSQYPAMLRFNSAVFLLGSLYEKVISRFDALKILRGWILVDLVKKPDGPAVRK